MSAVAFQSGSEIWARYTGWAPDASTASETVFGPTLKEAFGRVLQRLERQPREIRLRDLALGDVAVLSARQGEPVRPLAFLSGTTAADLAAALNA
jgi:hypothetical protein